MADSSDIIFLVTLATVIIFFLLIVFIITLFTSYRQRLRQQAEVADLRLVYEQELRQVEGEVGEQMMERFSQELHDNIGHVLTNMRLQIENKKLDKPELEDELLPIETTLADASRQLKMLSRSLNTDYVSNIGLEAAISIEVEKLEQLKRFTVGYSKGGHSQTLDKDRELMVFRIFQEIIHNTTKHSKATSLQIALFANRNELLRIKDDGKGFILGDIINSGQASGLRNIVKRAQLAGLSCTINTAPGRGCEYVLNKISGS